nr:FAR1 DNA binding domain, zinc finger, SWIM-type, MULE transposase domain, FHY3/FAR1 family [Tanacetum cinerariifolium]
IDQDNSPRIHRNAGYEGQMSGTVAGARETVGEDDFEIVKVRDHVAYGKKAGFDVRLGEEYKAVGFGDATTKFRDPKKKQTRMKPTFRCGCLASLTIKRIGNVFEVTSLIEGHNHPLVAEKMIFMKNSRNIGYTKQHFLYQVSNANFGLAIGFRLIKHIHGGFDMVGVTVNDCKNQKQKISVYIGDQDSQIDVENLLSQKLYSLGFYANYYKGDDDRLVGLFWADEEAIRTTLLLNPVNNLKVIPQHQSQYLLKILNPVSIYEFIIMSNINNNMQTQTSNTLHNTIMEAGSKDRPLMLAPGNYVQSKSRIKRYIDTKRIHELIHYCLENPLYEFGWKDKLVPDSDGNLTTTTERVFETYKNVTQDIRDQLNAEAEAVQIILTGIDNDIYSTVDACSNACKMWKAIERLKQGDSINNSSTRLQQAATRNRGKAIVNYHQPIYDQEPSMVDDDETSKDKEIDKLMALISPSIGNVAGARETVGSTVKPKRAKDAAYHREKMLLCKQEETGIQLNAKQADWKDDTDDEFDYQELEAHYMYIAKIQEVSPDAVDSGPIFDTEPEQK